MNWSGSASNPSLSAALRARRAAGAVIPPGVPATALPQPPPAPLPPPPPARPPQRPPVPPGE